jgi:hypothetical protein
VYTLEDGWVTRLDVEPSKWVEVGALTGILSVNATPADDAELPFLAWHGTITITLELHTE